MKLLARLGCLFLFLNLTSGEVRASDVADGLYPVLEEMERTTKNACKRVNRHISQGIFTDILFVLGDIRKAMSFVESGFFNEISKAIKQGNTFGSVMTTCSFFIDFCWPIETDIQNLIESAKKVSLPESLAEPHALENLRERATKINKLWQEWQRDNFKESAFLMSTILIFDFLVTFKIIQKNPAEERNLLKGKDVLAWTSSICYLLGITSIVFCIIEEPSFLTPRQKYLLSAFYGLIQAILRKGQMKTCVSYAYPVSIANSHHSNKEYSEVAKEYGYPVLKNFIRTAISGTFLSRRIILATKIQDAFQELQQELRVLKASAENSSPKSKDSEVKADVEKNPRVSWIHQFLNKLLIRTLPLSLLP
jgi:hypothetical protein